MIAVINEARRVILGREPKESNPDGVVILQPTASLTKTTSPLYHG